MKARLPDWHDITEKRSEVLVELSVWQAHHKRPPTIQDLADMLGRSYPTVHEHLQRLLRDGYVDERGYKYVVSRKGWQYLED